MIHLTADIPKDNMSTQNPRYPYTGMHRFPRLRLLYRYSVGGVLAFTFELFLLYLLLPLLPYYFAVPMAFAGATLAQYAVCHWWVFGGSGRAIPLEYTYFILILGSGLMLATLLTAALVEFAGLNVFAARIAAAAVTGLFDFYLNAKFNFRSHAFLRPPQR
jgi:putative flippase GtrA